MALAFEDRLPAPDTELRPAGRSQAHRVRPGRMYAVTLDTLHGQPWQAISSRMWPR